MPRHPRQFVPGATYPIYCRVARGWFIGSRADTIDSFPNTQVRRGESVKTVGPGTNAPVERLSLAAGVDMQQ
jgi:hypothetical protein